MGPAQNCTIHPQHLLPSPSSGGGEAEGGGAKWSARARCRRRWRFAGGSIGSARTTPVVSFPLYLEFMVLHRDIELLEGCKKLQTFRNLPEGWERQQKQHFQPNNGPFLND
uniref:Uncharacterized protein n=1 Tax=Oryza barthii TaxID=65489 RepID=A0A0D3F1V0_9ORYZ